jgi:RND family efflux transporter MFP subunit
MLDEARGKFEIAKAELAVTQAREIGFRATVEKTQSLVDFATLRAPFDGVITERWTDPGELIQPGTTKMFHLMKVDSVRIRIDVPEVDVPHVRQESVAKITFRELQGTPFESPVSRIFWALLKSTKTMWVEIDVQNKERVVRPGMFAQVEIELEAYPEVLVLPAAALVTEKKKSFVFIVKDDVAKKVPVSVGVDTGIEFEVKEGIQPSDWIIVSGKNLVSDGTEVRAKREGSP